MTERKRISFRCIGGAGRKYDALPGLLYANYARNIWGASLRENGFAGLLFRDTGSLGTDSWDGDNDTMQLFFRSYWEQKVEESKAEFVGVTTPLNAPDEPGIFTLKEDSWTRATEIMCMVTEAVVEATEEKSLKMNSPQLFVSSRAGFNQRYMLDFPGLAYRCLFFLGTEGVDRQANENCEMNLNPSQESAFISTGGPDASHDFGSYKALRTKVLFTEALRKFKVYTGDIVIVRADWPFTVDLPIADRMPNARMLSWAISCIHPAPTNPIPRFLMSLQQCGFKDEKADSIHHQEIEAVQEYVSRHTTEVSTREAYRNMKRLRVTPQLYNTGEIRSRLENADSIQDVLSWFEEASSPN